MMSKEEAIRLGNIDIAEFDKQPLTRCTTKFSNGEEVWVDCIFKYHSSWEWLMDIVEKIEAIKDDYHGYFGVHISSNSCCIQATNLDTRPETFYPAYSDSDAHDTKILATWECVVRFIRWYKKYNDEKQTA